MPNKHPTHSSEQFRALHESVLDIVALMNRPQRDEHLLKAAGISIERSLFPLVVAVAKRGPIGIVDLAECIGRDYTTVSRQVTRLEQLGLVERRGSTRDGRVREAVITDTGRAITDRIDEARERIVRRIFADWDDADVAQLVILMRRFADAMMRVPEAGEPDVSARPDKRR